MDYFKTSSISGGAWGAVWEEEAATAPEDAGCPMLETLTFTREPPAESQDEARKVSGFHCHHPREKRTEHGQYSLQSSPSQGKDKKKKSPQQAFQDSQDENRAMNGLPQCLTGADSSFQAVPENSSASWPCQSAAALTPTRWPHLSPTSLQWLNRQREDGNYLSPKEDQK